MINSIVDRLPHEIERGRFAVLLRKVNASGRFTLRILDDRQTVVGAQLIGQRAEPPVHALITVELFAVPHIHGVE